MVSEWTVDTPERQQAIIEALTAAWKQMPWPNGLVSATLLASTDGETVLMFARWANGQAYEEFIQTHRKALADHVDHAVLGIQRKPAVDYRFYRGTQPGTLTPGCVVIVSAEFDGPDPVRQKKWVDTIFEAMAERLPHPGSISARFHLSNSGLHVLSYAEWVDEASHREAFEQSVQTARSGSKWSEAREFPGLKSARFKRYRSGLSLVPPRHVQ